ncbi:MAG: large conductance mechanosensitive channel protein MscL [Candidatus Pacebacteria bacterium]|nr:large conductance mechanosensitive channel protein MscL [Candidatus Paceibacterota bacterium]
MLQEFKKFILRGNVVDLAVGVMVGAAFGSVVSSLVSDILTPFIGVFAKVPDFAGWTFTINSSHFMIGKFINNLISFLIVSFTIYFFIVLPINSLNEKTKKESQSVPTTKKCPECDSDVPIKAKKCPFCTSHIS